MGRYIGMCILDISKIVMYRFHYDYMMKKFPGAKLLFTDTDSFCYWIPTESNIYEDIKGEDWFDFSNYPQDHPNYDTINKLVPGKFKDEMGGTVIIEFVGLRAKMYSILASNTTKKTSLSPFNDKKWISRDGDRFKTYSFGHYRIVEEEIEDCLVDLVNNKLL